MIAASHPKLDQGVSASVLEQAERDLYVGQLPGFTTEFQDNTPGEVVNQHFKENPLLPAILIMRGQNLLGMLPRSTYFQLLSRPHGEVVYKLRPISLMLEHGNVVTTPLSSETTVNAAIEWCLSRPPEYIYEPIVISTGTSYKIVHFHELIIAQSKLLEETMRRSEEQRSELEEKNREILDSIVYAERIQKSILRGHEKIDCPDLGLFFLFRPRDIVSGDFFWVTQMGEKVFVAAVDCTGHGVPGAFMSLLGHNFLDDIVRSKGIVAPERILSNLHENIRRSLNQSNEARSGRDGMDVCLCVIDTAAGTLRFSGAKRPLYYTLPDGTLQVCKGDRYSIGGLQREEERIFTSHEIDLKPGQTFYLTTDGYADQPSESNQKFGSQRLRALMKESVGIPFELRQLQFETVLDNHKRNQPQRDDITLVGVEWRRY